MWLKSDLLLILPWITLQWIHRTTSSPDATGKIDIDKFISDYIMEVERTQRPFSEGPTITKRSTDSDMDIYQLQGVDQFVGFQEEFSLPVKFPTDLILFSHCPSGVKDEQILYACTLEDNEPNASPAVDLVLYKYLGGVWEERDHVRVAGGVRLAAEQIGDITYIIVAEYHALVGRGSPILYFVDTGTDTFQFVQMLDNHFASDVIMWKWEDMEAFAAVAISENEPDSENRYSTLSPVYHWEGGSHWNMIGTLPTHNPRALTQFTIGSSMYIAVANFQNDLGETAVESEIFHFDLPSNKISLYQKLPTNAAVDIKYFCFQGHRTTERFLVYASAFHKDEEGEIDYNAPSVVYKLSDEKYFVPFQALTVPGITSWHPVHHVKDQQGSLILLAATYEGVASFQYDGWRFVPTGVTYDSSPFSPGPKSIKIFYLQDQAFIGVANKGSPGFEVNVFRPVFKRDPSVEEFQREFAAWEKRISRQLAAAESKMASLLDIARGAPSVNDQVINLGLKVTFVDVDIDHVETGSTKAGADDINAQVNNQLFYLNTQLESVESQLKTLKNKIDQITFTELILYEDIVEPKADIECVHACRTEELEVSQINGENFPEFLANTVNIEMPIEFDEDITFDTLALIDPLEARMINGHLADSVVDWSKDVRLEHGLKVEGDVILKNNLSIGGLLDGVAINLVSRVESEGANETVVVSPARLLKNLNTSQLTLSDGMLSGVEFDRFQKFTLKTQGDQIFTEFQDFESVEADMVVANKGFRTEVTYKSPFHSSCKDGEACKDTEELAQENILRAVIERSDSNIEAISYLDNEITITTDYTIYEAVIIQNGILVAQDLVDIKHNTTATKIMDFGIPLDNSNLNNHFEFHSGFKAANLSVDSLNGVNLSSLRLMDLESLEPVVLTARKEFKGGFAIDGSVEVSGTVNGVNISQYVETLRESSEVRFDNLTLYSLCSSNIEFDGGDWQHVIWMGEDGVVSLKDLRVESSAKVNSLRLQRNINDLDLEQLLQDTVYNDENLQVITGKKYFSSGLKISKLTLTNPLNGVDFNTLTHESMWAKRLSRAKVVKVDRLYYKGYLDGIEASDFGEWMLTEGDQTIMGSQTIHGFSAVHANTHIVNSVDIQTLITEAIFTFDNATLKLGYFEQSVESPGLIVGGRLECLKVPEDLLLSDTNVSQQVSAHKQFLSNVNIQGDFRPDSPVSAIDFKGLCQALSNYSTHIVITGSAIFKKEPNISVSVNNKTWTELMQNIWFKEDDVVIKNPTQILQAKFINLLVENINNNNVEESLSKLVSLSRNESINGTFFFTTMTMQGGLEAGEASVAGRVQGLKVQSFVRTVLLDEEDQEFTGIPDFNHLIVDGLLFTEGFVNSLNLSKDVMLNNVANNTLTSSLALSSLSVKRLMVAPGTLMAGADVTRWNRTAVKRSGRSVITGNIVFKGQFDPARGIRIDGLVNNIPFDKNHLMLTNTPQVITGAKTFSPQAKLDIQNLTVGSHLNDINITDFYNQQVTTSGNASISGSKKFSLPLYCGRAVLPEVYQGYNLIWLDTQLSFPLPWDEYRTQLAALGDTRREAEQSLAGQAYYLKNVSRVMDIEGIVLYAFPLKSLNSTVLGVIRLVENKTTLLLLHWIDKYNMFHEKPDSVLHFLKEAPVDIQSVALPREIAVYITRYIPNNSSKPEKYGELLSLRGDQIHSRAIRGGQPGSKLLMFQDYSAKTCYIVVADVCRVFCPMEETWRIGLTYFPCQNVTELTVLATPRAVYLAGLQAGSLVVWRLQGKRFFVLQTEPQFNPVSVGVTLGGIRAPLVAVANRRLVGSSRPETVDMYRLNEDTGKLSLEQQLMSVSPKQILFATLPSRETVLYVTSDNPATHLAVFVYRGVLGYQLFTVERTLPRPTHITAFTDYQQRHFVLLNSEREAQVLEAQFYGGRSLN